METQRHRGHREKERKREREKERKRKERKEVGHTIKNPIEEQDGGIRFSGGDNDPTGELQDRLISA